MQAVNILCCLFVFEPGLADLSSKWNNIRSRFEKPPPLWFMPTSLQREEILSDFETSGKPKESSWPDVPTELGQISGVAVDMFDRPVVFHRGPVTWDSTSFDISHRYRKIADGPIDVDTIVTLDPVTGDVLKSWGSGLFYMPHGLTVDVNGNTWVTDVALHQIFKFKPNSTKPALILGRRFSPGSDENHFCKPTSIAVASTGTFYVADGYCNNRIMMYSSGGTLIGQIGRQGSQLFPNMLDQFLIPHGLVLIEDQDKLCVADRENSRISCFNAGLKELERFGEPLVVSDTKFSGRPYGITAHGTEESTRYCHFFRRKHSICC
ncbi:hypothetical protein QYM36_005912 [Artemia franciscana]|uniref:peptidylamidoglycolate lyase n=1 Tax=Artemia franciscana TaxID=6661 RepID=A0AA88LAY9_ARTSF|nr:hypothetical protein QYM36_005912 [Artemia franciscana]